MEIGQRRVFFRHDPVQVHNKVPQPQALLKQIFSGTPHVPCSFAHKLRKPCTQSAKKKKRLSGHFKTA